MINCPAATSRKKILIRDRNMCTRMEKFDEKLEGKGLFPSCGCIYIYMMDSLLVFFLFRFQRKGDAVLDEGTIRAKCTLLA